MPFPTPHLEKLRALLENAKLPLVDVPRLQEAIDRYNDWIQQLDQVQGDQQIVINRMVDILNEYKVYIELHLIFDSDEDFLYRQKGQVKLDNTIIEEFLPRMVLKALPNLANGLDVGPYSCFSSVYFTSTLSTSQIGGGFQIRTKDQDFAIGRKLYLKASHKDNFADAVTRNTYLGYIVAECKTNLDKTMFQEASATAHDVKTAVSGAKYYLLCEWLDMTPISTAPTDIDEVLILRKGKRISSNIRKNYSSVEGRKLARDQYRSFLEQNPFNTSVFERFVNHVESVLNDVAPVEDNVLEDGYF